MKTATIKIFLFLIFIWVALAVSNIFYNAYKSVSEVRDWAFLSENKKREMIFGDLHNFFIFIREHTEKKSRILIISKDVRTYYLGIYYLYPRIINSTDNEKKILELSNSENFTYIAVYGDEIKFDKYNKIASYSSLTTPKPGYLYKRK